MNTAWHQIISRAFRCGFCQHRSFNLQEPFVCQELAGQHRHFGTQDQVSLKIRTPQIQRTVFQTQFFFCFRIFLDRERRRLGLGKDSQILAHNFQRASCQILVHCAGTKLYGTGHSRNKLTAQLSCFRKHFLAALSVFKNDLHDSGSVAQIHKDQPSFVPVFLYPSHQGYFFSYIGLCHLAAAAGTFQPLH